jgi:hypothetical protein
MKYRILILLLVISPFCKSQDTAVNTFRINKIYATAAGKTGGTINRYILSDTAEIKIHNCDSCKVLGFKMTGKIRYRENNLFDPSNGANSKDSVIDIQNRYYNSELYSDTTLFTYSMEQFIRNNKMGYRTFYIEIYDINIRTPDKRELMLNKLCFNLQ